MSFLIPKEKARQRRKIPANKQVPHPIRKERAAILRKLGDKQVEKFLKLHVKQKRQVIVEKGNIGRTEHFAPVMLDQGQTVGSLVDVMIHGIEEQQLTGQVL